MNTRCCLRSTLFIKQPCFPHGFLFYFWVKIDHKSFCSQGNMATEKDVIALKEIVKRYEAEYASASNTDRIHLGELIINARTALNRMLEESLRTEDSSGSSLFCLFCLWMNSKEPTTMTTYSENMSSPTFCPEPFGRLSPPIVLDCGEDAFLKKRK